MKRGLRTLVAKLRQARRLLVRVELTISALQVGLWLALAAATVGAALLMRRRLSPRPPEPALTRPAAAASAV